MNYWNNQPIQQPTLQLQLDELQAKWQPIAIALQYLEHQKMMLDRFRSNIQSFFLSRTLPTTVDGVVTEVQILRSAIRASLNNESITILDHLLSNIIDVTPAEFNTIQSDIVNGEMIRQLEVTESLLYNHLQQLLSPTQRDLLDKRLEKDTIFML